MDSMRVCCVLVLLIVSLVRHPALVVGGGGVLRCDFPAIYNFGDSNSDTGGISAALSEIHAPNGETFFGHPSGRACDGRLIIDFIANELKLLYLSAYLDSLGTNFRHGANFATGGSSIRPGGYGPFHLGIQTSQFIQFKSRTTALYNQLSPNSRETPLLKTRLSRPKDFSKAIYTFDIGQNDLGFGFQYTTIEEVRLSIPNILSQLSQAVHLLYKEGAIVFRVHNTGPIVCLPYSVIYQSKSGNLDQIGCVKPQNKVAQEFNRQLKDMVFQLRAQLPNAAFTYVDVFSAKYDLISNAKNEGFVDPFEFYCGSFYGYHID
ncbi:GDSL esterase/lipase At3g27950-like [Quercus lobata]|uniref:GDSL esterase/lipase At3g27950-like n=1 Tax=Quercus lobata TaxID=97700 RepID=UPI0012456881|nr:GDSL esterase/lipase At3g27950-like [Quercus lobata]